MTEKSDKYEKLCKVILETFRAQGFRPCKKPNVKDPGLKVPFEIGGTTWEFDVALENDKGELVVAECKCWNTRKVNQATVGAFAWSVHCLRAQCKKVSDSSVAAFLMIKKGVQSGGHGAAKYADITIVECDEGQLVNSLVASFVTYDDENKQLLRTIEVSLNESIDGITDCVEQKLIR